MKNCKCNLRPVLGFDGARDRRFVIALAENEGYRFIEEHPEWLGATVITPFDWRRARGKLVDNFTVVKRPSYSRADSMKLEQIVLELRRSMAKRGLKPSL